MMWRVRRWASLIGVLAIAACGGSSASRHQPSQPPATSQNPSPGATNPAGTHLRREPPSIPLYEPAAVEEFPNAKRLAGRVAQRMVTYSRGTSVAQVAARAAGRDRITRRLVELARPLVSRERRSWGNVVYVQSSGVTPRSFGAMVLVRQRSEDRRGRRHQVTRVFDVRLRRDGGPWSLDRIASVGGRPARRPADLPAAARKVVDHPSIHLSDTARWDIYRGRVEASLLRTLAKAADQWPISISVLRSGHPERVWATARTSAHRAGAAADIYAVAGRLVIRQRSRSSAAYRLAASLVAGGAAQVGSPWLLGRGGRRSFTDDVHQDHIHVQQSRVR
jgi:hypothetical protein